LRVRKAWRNPSPPITVSNFLFPPALEDWVPPVIRPLLARDRGPTRSARPGFCDARGRRGRPPYHPSLLLKIWLYGYYHRLRSTRKLEAACAEHLSLLWLTGLIAPDHNSLWRFWRDNQKVLRLIFQQTVQIAVRTGAVGLALQALDGTKLQALASTPKGWNKATMEKLLAQLDAACDDLELKIVEENRDVDAPGYRLPAGLAERKALREEIRKGLAQLAADGRQHYHRHEPEARRMKVGDTNRYAYNAQAVADAQEGVIVACDATRQENDKGQLVPLIHKRGKTLAWPPTTPSRWPTRATAPGADLQAAAENQMPVLVPPAESTPAKDNPYATQHFHYDAPTQTVTCPQDRQLDYEATPPKPACASNGFDVTRATVRCGPTARAIPKAGKLKSDRTPRWSKRCGSN